MRSFMKAFYDSDMSSLGTPAVHGIFHIYYIMCSINNILSITAGFTFTGNLIIIVNVQALDCLKSESLLWRRKRHDRVGRPMRVILKPPVRQKERKNEISGYAL